MHKYQPRFHVVRVNHINPVQLKVGNWTTCIFPETEFMAVTAYQNQQVSKGYIHNANAKKMENIGNELELTWI
jgi:hypothetical protein